MKRSCTVRWLVGLGLAVAGSGCSPSPATDAVADAAVDAAEAPLGRPNCQDLPATCGADRADNCCANATVPTGTYFRGYDLAGGGDMLAPATVSAFRLDTYEVTVGRFRAFVESGYGTRASPPASGDGAHAGISGSGWNERWNAGLVADRAALAAGVQCNDSLATWTDTPSGNEERPINCVTWYEAMAFCIWDGGYLPTEAEWNYASTGGSEQRVWPWSQPADSLLVSPAEASYVDAGSCSGDGMSGCSVTDLVPVGSKPTGNGRWGHADLAGNVTEWNLDWYDVTYPSPLDCSDCAQLTPQQQRVARGGHFIASAGYMRQFYRARSYPNDRQYFRGIRCAKPV